jgi:hypothetical protein
MQNYYLHFPFLKNTARPLNLLTEEVSSYLLLVLYALFAVLLMSISTTIPVEEVNLVVKFANQPFIPIRPTWKNLRLNAPIAANLFKKKRDSKQFFVYTCVNKHCPFYIHNLTSMSKDEKADFEKNPYKYKLHYYYRVFDIEIDSLKEDTHKPSTVDLSRIRNSKYVLGLVLAYHINYGLSTRQTASILWDIHNIKITHHYAFLPV